MSALSSLKTFLNTAVIATGLAFSGSATASLVDTTSIGVASTLGSPTPTPQKPTIQVPKSCKGADLACIGDLTAGILPGHLETQTEVVPVSPLIQEATISTPPPENNSGEQLEAKTKLPNAAEERIAQTNQALARMQEVAERRAEEAENRKVEVQKAAYNVFKRIVAEKGKEIVKRSNGTTGPVAKYGEYFQGKPLVCNTLTAEILREMGIQVGTNSPTSKEFARMTDLKPLKKGDQPEAGALVFMINKDGVVTHVGVAAGVNEKQERLYVNAGPRGGVSIVTNNNNNIFNAFGSLNENELTAWAKNRNRLENSYQVAAMKKGRKK